MPERIFPGMLCSLAEIGSFIRFCANKAQLNREDLYALELAVDEACTNIIEHAYGGDKTKNITCSCEESSDGVIVVIKDTGNDFNPSLSKKDILPLEQTKSRGLGIFLINHLMDEVRHEYVPHQGNVLTLVKRSS